MTALGPNAGTAHITVKPSLRGWSADVRRQLRQELKDLPPLDVPAPKPGDSERKGRETGEQYAGGFDRTVRRRIKASLDALPTPQIGVATNAAEQRIKDLRGQLQGLSEKKIGVDVDAGAAVAQLEGIRLELETLSAQSADIDVKADTILAATQLAAVAAEVKALDGATAVVDVKTSSAAFGWFDALSGRTRMLIGLFGAVALAAIPIGAVLVTMAATAVSALTAAAGGVGILMAALLGNIIPTIKAQSELKQKQEQAAGAASAYASAQQQVRSAVRGVEQAEISAGRAVADAQRAVADARRSAARSIQAAEQAVESAQDRARDAQQALNDARDAAREKLASYSSQLRQTALAERGAALSVTAAQEALNEVLSDPASSQLAIDQARLSLSEALFAYDESQKRRKDVRKQAAEDRAAGVAGDQAVIEAREQLAAANDEISRAEQQLGQARADAARSVADAERNLARARADGARQVAAAQEQVAMAQAAAAEAGQKAADAQAEVADRMAKLSGPAAIFVAALDRAKAAWAAFVEATAPSSFALAVQGLGVFTDLLPRLVPIANAAAAAVGTLLGDLSGWLNGPEGNRFLKWLEKSAPVAIVTIGRAIGNLAVGFGGLIGALTDSDTGFLRMTRRFAEWGRHAGKNGSVQRFFEYAKKNGPIVGEFIAELAKGFADVVAWLAPIGSLMLRVITIVAKGLNAIPDALKQFYLVGGLMGATLIHLWRKADWFRAALGKVWDAVSGAAVAMWRYGIRPVLRAFWGFITNVLVPVIRFLWNGIIRPVFGAIAGFVQGWWRRLLRPIFQAITYQLEKHVFPVFKYLWEKVFKPIFTWIGEKASNTWNQKIKPAFVALRDFVRDTLVPAMRRGFDKLGEIWDGLKKAAGTPVKFVVDTVYNNGIRKVINAIPGVDDVDPVDTKGWPSFARGGWTGPGSKYTPAGVVHADEFVVTKEARRLAERVAPGWLDGLNRAARGMVPGYANGGRVWPLPGAHTGTYTGHDGVDLNVGAGSDDLGMTFYAAAPGKVSHAGYGRGYGNAVFVRGSYGELVYGHAQDGSIMVSPGQSVSAGTPLARVGSTGNSSGPHLHFGFPGGTYAQAMAFLSGADWSNAKSAGGGGNPMARFLSAISTVKDFAKSVPSMLSRLTGMGAWGKLLRSGVKNLGGSLRGWVNDKIPGPGPFPSVFDSGGLARGRGLMPKDTIRPERVLSPAQTAAFERQVATLESWDANLRHLAASPAAPASGRQQLLEGRLRVLDWETGWARIEGIAVDAAEQVHGDHAQHDGRMAALDQPIGAVYSST